MNKDEIFEIYVICYKEMCKEIDVMTKPVRVDIIINEPEEVVYCENCGCSFLNIFRKEHNRSTKHMRYLIKENKYLLDWRVFDYMNKLNSKK